MKYFNLAEFKCSETGENKIDLRFVRRLDELRERCGFPFIINSGYRSPQHSIEAAKPRPGKHSQGIAADIAIKDSVDRYTILKHALDMGFGGIGIAKTYIHIDDRNTTPVMWVY